MQSDEAPSDEKGPLERYIAVLELIAAFPGALTMSDVAGLMCLPKATAHRLLSGLKRTGLVEGGGRNRPFLLGERMLRLAPALSEERRITAMVRPHLLALANEREQGSYIVRLVDHRIFVVAGVVPEGPWSSFVQPGAELPPHAAASAKAVLAFQSAETISMALRGPLARLTPQTCIQRAHVLKEYETVRRDGYAVCVSEIREGTGAISVPIPQSSGPIVHGIGITGPLRKILDDDMPARIESLHKTAAALSEVITLGTAIAARGVQRP